MGLGPGSVFPEGPRTVAPLPPSPSPADVQSSSYSN